jgi:UDP-glucose 4-epimerase
LARLLVTGVAGFIGSNIARAAIARGHQVFGVDNLSTGKIESVPESCDFEALDLGNSDVMSKLPRSCDAVLHLAGQASGEKSFENSLLDLDSNLRSTINLLEYSREAGVKRFLYASSMGVYGNPEALVAEESSTLRPLSPYGISKLAAEHHVRLGRKYFEGTSLRMFNVYGSGQSLGDMQQGMLRIYVGQAMSNQRIIVRGALSRVRDFIHIRDVEDIWLRALGSQKALPEALNVGTGVPTSVSEVTKLLTSFLPGTSVEVLTGTLGDQAGVVADNNLLLQTLGDIEFVKLKTGLGDYVEWAKLQ